jgi:hypothetical protein
LACYHSPQNRIYKKYSFRPTAGSGIMTVSDQDTKMDVDAVTPIDTHGAHTHLADPSLTLKGTV